MRNAAPSEPAELLPRGVSWDELAERRAAAGTNGCVRAEPPVRSRIYIMGIEPSKGAIYKREHVADQAAGVSEQRQRLGAPGCANMSATER